MEKIRVYLAREASEPPAASLARLVQITRQLRAQDRLDYPPDALALFDYNRQVRAELRLGKHSPLLPQLLLQHFVLTRILEGTGSGLQLNYLARLEVEQQLVGCSAVQLHALVSELRQPARRLPLEGEMAIVPDLGANPLNLVTLAKIVASRDRGQGPEKKIEAWHGDLLRRHDWAGYHARAVAVDGWTKSVRGSPLHWVGMALHPGWTDATLRERFWEDWLIGAIRFQSRQDVLYLEVARELWRRTHKSEPTPADIPDWPQDPFAPSRKLMLRHGKVWSVGPDGIEDGRGGTGDIDFTYKGDLKL